jgi:chemotaxis family two-component system sensor kinase Cph1
MKIKDIVNRDIVNLTNCEHEPIHIPGSIQPHGFLLGVRASDFTVDYCSANTSEYLGVTPAQLLSKSFAAIFSDAELSKIKEYIAKELLLSSTPLRLNLGGSDYLCTIHLSETIYVIEAEPVVEAQKIQADVYNQTSQFLTYMHDTYSLKELCAMVAKGTREVTGYDRVMIYRFDANYNGEVFAESVRNDLEPFLGLHYPHTDIPPQARELYMKNLLRLIVDINYTPVPIFTVDDSETKNLDLSLSVLRSTSPIHVQYLQNMGVGATLTISLIYQKRLWGLIACHHYSPKNLSPEIRLAAQLQGHFITSQISVRQSNEEYEVARKANHALEKLNAIAFAPTEASFGAIVAEPYLLQLCNATGVSIVFDGIVYKKGETPSDDEILKLSQWLSSHTDNSNFNTDKLTDHYPDFEECLEVSGIIYFAFAGGNGNGIIWYRPETVAEVNWAGDPNKAIVKDANGLYPRNSFKLWKEIVKCQSKPWLQPERNASANYAHILQKHVNYLIVAREEERYRKLNEVLQETNSELENINWISTHDLQEPLRKIQLISSRILDKGGVSEGVSDSIKRMNNSANRMQNLLVDILKYTRIKHNDASFEITDTAPILESAIADLAEMIHEKQAVITIGDLPVVKGVPFLLKQLFSNIILNSLKYVGEGVVPQIRIEASQTTVHPETKGASEKRYNTISFIDNGIGFEQKFFDSIFNIFSRLHSQSEYQGSGIGLALCKKIMQAHQGFIVAKSELGQGATFTLYFPEVEISK